jgi:hypothetical protein
MPLSNFHLSRATQQRWSNEVPPTASADLARSGPCHMVLPTLIVEPDPIAASRLLARFRAMGNTDVDVVGAMDAAMRSVGEREYAIVALREDVAGHAMAELFVRAAMACDASGQPAILLIGSADAAGTRPQEVGRLDPECDDGVFTRTVRAAIATSGTRCKSAPYCRRTTCPLDTPSLERRT